jgi:hypothetical protein
MIYNLRCPSASFFAPLDHTHRVALGRFGLVSILLCLICDACVVIAYLISVRPSVIVIACCLGRSPALPCWFHLRLEVRDILDASSCEAILALDTLSVATVTRSDAVAVSNCGVTSTVPCRVHSRLC